MKINKFILILAISLSLSSCYWHNWDTINPGASAVSASCSVKPDSILYNGVTIYRNSNSVDTGTIMSYSLDVAPIVSSKCASSTACHGAGASGLAKDYSFYGDNATGLYSDCRHDTTGSQAWQYIRGASGDPMPKPGNPQLTTCEINKIRNWIHQGAQNN